MGLNTTQSQRQRSVSKCRSWGDTQNSHPCSEQSSPPSLRGASPSPDTAAHHLRARVSWCGHALRHRGRLPVPPLHQHHPRHGLLRPGSAPPALPGGSSSPVTRGEAACRLPTRCPCSPAASAGHPAPLTRADRPPAPQAAQHLLPVRNLGPKPWFSTFFLASNFFSDMLSEIPPNPLGPAQRGGQQTALPSQPPASYWVHRNHILGPPGSHTSVFFPLSSPFFAVLFYLSSRK